MDSIELTSWKSVAKRGIYDPVHGRILNERAGQWRVPASGFYLECNAAVAAIYRSHATVWWQVGDKRIELHGGEEVECRSVGRNRWILEVADGEKRLSCEYSCLSLDEMIAQDPTFDPDQYIDFNIGALVGQLVRDSELRAIWLAGH